MPKRILIRSEGVTEVPQSFSDALVRPELRYHNFRMQLMAVRMKTTKKWNGILSCFSQRSYGMWAFSRISISISWMLLIRSSWIDLMPPVSIPYRSISNSVLSFAAQMNFPSPESGQRWCSRQSSPTIRACSSWSPSESVFCQSALNEWYIRK